MLELNENDGTVTVFERIADLCSYLMAMENEKLLGCDLYLILEKDLIHGEVPSEHTPAVIKAESGTFRLVLNTRDGVKQIANPIEIGIEAKTLNAFFDENPSKEKIFLVWDSPLLEAITTKGGHNKFWGDHIKAPWSFLVLTPNRIAMLLNTLKKPYDHLMLLEAWEKQFTVIEVCKGDFKDLKQIIVQSGDQIQALQQEWCQDYCNANRLSFKQIKE